MATNNRMALLEELRKYLADKDTDFLREAVTLFLASSIYITAEVNLCSTPIYISNS